MKILIYSSNLCPYCFAAKKLLKKLDLNYTEIVIDNKPKLKNQMISDSNGKKTVPQIFYSDGKHFGDYEKLEKTYV